MANQLVLAFFENEAAADAAVTQVKGWDKASKEVKLGAIGVLVKDDKGKIKTQKLGARKTGTGAVLFGLAGLLSGGMTVLGGAIFGGIAGSLLARRPWLSWPTPMRRQPSLQSWPSWAASRNRTR